MDKNKDSKDKEIVLVGGCFDILHFGHISFLCQAKEYGDYLMVLLESDQDVKKLKGETRPIHTQEQRKYMLESLSVVNEVFLLPPMNGNDAYTKLIQNIRPSVIAVTQNDPFLVQKTNQAQLIGARIVVIPKIESPSTSKLVKLLGLE